MPKKSQINEYNDDCVDYESKVPLFMSITMYRGIDSIPLNIPRYFHIQYKYRKYMGTLWNVCQSHITLLQITVML